MSSTLANMTDKEVTRKRSLKFLVGMCTLMLGANLVWIAFNSVLLPTLIENISIDRRGLILGLIGFSGTLLGVIVSILAGITSDQAGPCIDCGLG